MEVAPALTFIPPIHFAVNLWMKRIMTEKTSMSIFPKFSMTTLFWFSILYCLASRDVYLDRSFLKTFFNSALSLTSTCNFFIISSFFLLTTSAIFLFPFTLTSFNSSTSFIDLSGLLSEPMLYHNLCCLLRQHCTRALLPSISITSP